MIDVLLKTLPFFAIVGLGYGAARMAFFPEVGSALPCMSLELNHTMLWGGALLCAHNQLARNLRCVYWVA